MNEQGDPLGNVPGEPEEGRALLGPSESRGATRDEMGRAAWGVEALFFLNAAIPAFT